MGRRVAFVVLEDFPGSENRVRRQARALRDDGWEVRIYAPRGRETVRNWEGVHIDRSWLSWRKADRMRRRIWEYTVFPIVAGWWVIRQAASWHPDVVHIATMPDWLVYSGLPARWLARSKVVLDLHELMPELLLARGGSSWQRRILESGERTSVRRADLVLVPTPGCRELLLRRTGVTATVVLNGVDPAAYPIVEPRVFMRAPERPTIGYHGTIARRFGVQTVIEAVALLRDRGVNCRFEVFGAGIDAPALERLAEERGVADRVRFQGIVHATDLPPIVRTFDIGVVPLVDEPFTRIAYSTKLFEYVALGVPVVCSDIASMRELFGPDAVSFAAAGDPASWADAIDDAISRHGEAVEKARRAQAQLGEYIWPNLGPAYVELIGKLVG